MPLPSGGTMAVDEEIRIVEVGDNVSVAIIAVTSFDIEATGNFLPAFRSKYIFPLSTFPTKKAFAVTLANGSVDTFFGRLSRTFLSKTLLFKLFELLLVSKKAGSGALYCLDVEMFVCFNPCGGRIMMRDTRTSIENPTISKATDAKSANFLLSCIITIYYSE